MANLATQPTAMTDSSASTHTLIQHVRLICPATGLDAVLDLEIRDGLISAIGDSTHQTHAKPAHIIDGTDCVLSTGLIDVSARLREPGYEHKNAMHTELKAAVAGGVTTVVCPLTLTLY